MIWNHLEFNVDLYVFVAEDSRDRGAALAIVTEQCQKYKHLNFKAFEVSLKLFHYNVDRQNK